MIPDPIPLEESDPWLAEQFRQIVQGIHPVVKHLVVGSEDVRVLLKPQKLVAPAKVGRNDPCPYCEKNGIHIKFKKCSIHNA